MSKVYEGSIPCYIYEGHGHTLYVPKIMSERLNELASMPLDNETNMFVYMVAAAGNVAPEEENISDRDLNIMAWAIIANEIEDRVEGLNSEDIQELLVYY